MDSMELRHQKANWLTVAALSITISFSGCLDDGSEVTVGEQTQSLPFERVARGQFAAVGDTMEVVVKDTTRWQMLADAFDLPAQRNVDFDQMMLLLVAMPAPTGGYDVQFRSVEIEDRRVVARYAVGVPGDDCITTMGQTIPFDVVAVRRTEIPVVFERTQETIPCTFR